MCVVLGLSPAAVKLQDAIGCPAGSLATVPDLSTSLVTPGSKSSHLPAVQPQEGSSLSELTRFNGILSGLCDIVQGAGASHQHTVGML